MLNRMNNLVGKINQWCLRHPLKIYVITSVIFMIAWLPYFLTYFPGVIRYDEILCVKQALGDLPLSNHQPLIFVFFIKIVIELMTGLGASVNTAIAVGTALQMFFLSLILSYVVSFIRNRTSYGWCPVIATLFFAFSPIIALYSVMLCKDTFFTGWLLIYCILVYKICAEEYLEASCKNVIKFIPLAIIVGLARSNGMYIVIFMFIILGITRTSRKYIYICGMSTLLIIGLIKGPVFDLLHVQSPSLAESFSVPIQQIGNTLVQGGDIKEADMEYLNQILPIAEWKKSYNPDVTDPIKFNEQFQRSFFDQTSKQFLQVWFRNMIPNLKYYVEAYLKLMRGYWDVSLETSIDGTEVRENPYGIEKIDLMKQWTGFSVEPLLTLLVLVMQKLPIVNFTMNQIILFLLYFLIFIIYCRRKVGHKALIFMPLLLLYLTLLIAAPVSSNFRYMLSFHFMLPVGVWSIVSMFFDGKEKVRYNG